MKPYRQYEQDDEPHEAPVYKIRRKAMLRRWLWTFELLAITGFIVCAFWAYAHSAQNGL